LKFLIPFALLFALPATSASAAPTIPPTKECLDLTAKILKKLPVYASNAQEKKALRPLVAAGCITKGPFDKITPAPAKKCQAYIDSASKYLAPINAEAAADPTVRAVIKRATKIDRRYDKKTRVLDRRYAKALKKGNLKAVNKISKRIGVINKKAARLKKKALLSEPKIFNNYLANFNLVFIDLVASGCGGGDYDNFIKKTPTLIRLALNYP
jgi:hypothetical protein